MRFRKTRFVPMSYNKAEKMLDSTFSRMVKERDSWVCQRCGSNRIVQCAHLFSRKHKSIRWNFDNAVTLCKGCHKFWAHVEYEEFRDFMLARIGQKKFNNLKRDSEMDWHMGVGELLLMNEALAAKKWKLTS